MKGSRWAGALLVGASLSVAGVAVADAQEAPAGTHPAACWAHTANDDSNHGTYTEDGEHYTLFAFRDEWVPWTHYESLTLIFDGGPVLNFDHPQAGTYPSGDPDSKLINVVVCKGEDLPEQPTDSTASTIVDSTVAETTTSTAPETTATSTAPETTPAPTESSAPPEQVVVTTDAVVLDQDVTAACEVDGAGNCILPSTGSASGWLLLVASLSAFSGTALLIVRRRPATS